MGIESILTPRLRAIAGSVPQGAIVADVGTDHAYIPVYLCQTGKIKAALAMDVHLGPLERAERNIERFSLDKRIQTRLSDGLAALLPGEADTAVIAGMGGLLIAQILEAAPFFLDTYILQPMTAVAELRVYLATHGYKITREVLAQEDNKLYTVMTVCRGQMQIASPVYELVGEELIKERDPLTPQLIDGLLLKHEQMLSGLNNCERAELLEKKSAVLAMILSLKKLKEECSQW